MVEASQWYSLISIASSSTALLVAAYVVRKIPNRRAGDTFVLAMVFFVLAGTFAYLLRTSTLDPVRPNDGPLTIARLFYFFHMLAVGFTAAFIGQYFLGFEVMRRRLVNLFLQASLLVVAIGVSTQVTELTVEDGGIGVVVESHAATLSLALFATIFMSTALAVLVKTLIQNKDPIVRKQTLLMTAGIVIHGIGAETYAISRNFLDLYPPPFLTITALAMAALFATAIVRYKMLVVTPQKEAPIALPRRFDLKGGRAYFVRERRPKIVFLALAEAARLGSMGLVVTRRHPAEVREDYDLPATPVLWLTSSLGQNHMPPAPPERIERVVQEFVTAQPQAIIAIEGVEYLATYVSPDRLVRCLHTLRDLATFGGGILLVSADPGSLPEPVTSVLDRDFDPLDLPAKTEYGVEDVFVIEGSGLLLNHASRSEGAETDPDVMAGMLTAIMNFARISFAEGSDELRRLELGHKTVVIERSQRFILAVAVTGTPPSEMRDEMQRFLERAERRYGPSMARWSGDPNSLEGLQAMTSRLFL
ncbi:MAG TPA: DUF835 domain-containing protein [Thermoplasmata archaeon]|nr:DUF835 domain-containing protein [Thermoplasmata archaeon]